MIITRTPFRISFFGGGTDYPVWYREHGGAVLTSSINRYCHITCRYLPPFFEHKSHIIWSHIERVHDHEEIAHPVVRATLRLLGIEDGVVIHHDGDLPARSGIGSSSAFTVGLLNALYALTGRVISKAAMAQQAIHIEREILGETVGDQDQIETAFGGVNRIDISPDGSFRVAPVTIGQARQRDLQSHLALYFTGVARHASSIAAETVKALPSKQSELHAMRQMVDEATALLASQCDIEDFGRLLHESWMLKRSIAKNIAPGFMDEIYDRARAAGATGGKVLGAGGGGFMVFFIRPELKPRLDAALSDLIAVPIEFEQGGSQVIFYDGDRDRPTPPLQARAANLIGVK